MYRSAGPRDLKILPITIQSELVRIDIRFLTAPAPAYYKAGWFNQIITIQGKRHIKPGFMVPVAPSIYKIDADRPYRIKFNPVQYLFPCVVTFYYSL